MKHVLSSNSHAASEHQNVGVANKTVLGSNQ